MVRILKDKPNGFFEDLPDHFLWFELFNLDGTYALMGIEILGMWASFHFQSIRWSHNIVKNLRKDWIELKLLCVAKGVKELIASNSDINDITWIKFIKLFGFPKPQTILISKQGV